MASTFLFFINFLTNVFAADLSTLKDSGYKRNLLFSNCTGMSSEVTVRIKSELSLQENFLSSDESIDSQIKDGIKKQILYLSSAFVNEPVVTKKNSVFTPNSEDPEILNYSKTDGSIYFRMNIDSPPVFSVPISEKYVLNALKSKKVEVGNRTIKIRYEALQKGFLCEKRKSNFLNIALPIDPYLAYWFTDPEDRKKISWGDTSAILNPCVHPEFVETPHPSYFWYYWNVNQLSINDHINCRKELNLKKQIFLPKLSIEKRTSSNFKELSFKNLELEQISKVLPLKMTFIFGIIDPKKVTIPWSSIIMNKKYDEIQNALSPFYYKLVNHPSDLDRGSRFFLNFLEQFEEFVEIKKESISNHAGSLVLSGRLKSNQRPLELEIFFGRTDVLGDEPPEHFPLLKSAFSDSRFLVYTGHSGLGLNLELSDEYKNKEGPDGQWIWIFSCYSYRYFEEKILKARKALSSTKNTWLTMTARDQTTDRGALEVLRLLSDETNQKPSYLRNDDFIITTHQSINNSNKNSSYSKGAP